MASNLRVDQIIASTSDSVSIGTATFTGGLSGDITGLNVTGVITATTLNQNVSGVVTATGGFVVGTGASISSPATNVLTLGTNNAEVIRVTSSGDIGINSTSPARKLDVVDSGASGSVVRSRVTTNNGGYLAYEALNSSGTSVFSVTHNGRINLSENIVFASGQGLDFSATANSSGTVSSEVLSDYEEGTWTPFVTSDGAGVNGSNIFSSYTTQAGRYTKIGNRVMFSFHIQGDTSFSYQNNGSNGQGSRIGGLPFTSGNTVTYPSVHLGYYSNFGASWDSAGYGFTPFGYVNNSSTQIILLYPFQASNVVLPTDSLASVSFQLIMSGHYDVA